MSWASAIYMNASLVVAILAGLNAGWIAGCSAFGASALSMIAGMRLKNVLNTKPQTRVDRDLKFGAIITAVAALGIAYWLSSKFSVQLFGHVVDGVVWSAGGALGCFLLTPKLRT